MSRTYPSRGENGVTLEKDFAAVCLEGNRMSIFSRLAILGSLALATVGFVSCGSGASNNDQGTAVTAVGYFAPNDLGVFDCQVGQTSVILPLFADSNPQGFDGLAYYTSMGVQNNLSVQSFRITRLDCSYEIPGSNLVIPDHSIPTGRVLAPLEAENASTQFPQFACMPFVMIPPSIISFINNNQNSTPQPPYSMQVQCSATGVTQAGDTLTTNPLFYDVQFVDIEEGVGDGFVRGPGTGGTPLGGAEFGTLVEDPEGTDGSFVDDEFVIE